MGKNKNKEIEKGLCTIGKIKTKNDYVQLQMKVFQFHT